MAPASSKVKSNTLRFLTPTLSPPYQHHVSEFTPFKGRGLPPRSSHRGFFPRSKKNQYLRSIRVPTTKSAIRLDEKILFFSQFLLEKKLILAKKKKKKFSPRPRLDSNSLTPKKHSTGHPRAMPPRTRDRCPRLRSHTHLSAVRPSQTTFHSDDVITRGVGLFDTKRYTDAPYYY